MVPFRPRRAQQAFFNAIVAQHRAGFPVRIIILKSRRLGFSAATSALFYTLAFNQPDTFAFVCAHDKPSSVVLFDRVRLFHQFNPERDDGKMDYENRYELYWKVPHNSKFQVQQAGKTTLKRGDLIHLAHLSEAAWYENDASTIQSVLSCVPNVPGTIVIIESTANTDAGAFADRWGRAVAHQVDNPGSLDEYIPLFFSPLDDPECVMPVPKNYKGGQATEAELRLVHEFGSRRVTKDHLYWRRRILEDQCGNDDKKLQRDYPYTPGEAFIGVGSAVFEGAMVKAHGTQVRPPKYAQLEWDGDGKRVKVIWCEYEGEAVGCWKIWAEPQEGMDYAMGADPAVGELSDKNDFMSDRDWSAIGVLDRSSLETAAEYIGRPSPAELAVEMEKAHCLYNRAFMAPEINAHGYSTLERLLADGYARWLGQREAHIENMAGADPAKYGYLSTSDKNQRIKLGNDWEHACSTNWYQNKGATIICRSQRLLDEEKTWVRDAKGFYHHRPGRKYHDDCLMAWLIALHVHKTCPRTRTVYQAPIRPITDGRGVPTSYMRDGGRDDMLSELEEPSETEELEVS